MSNPSIQIFKFSNGDEIIGEREADEMLLKRPLKVVLVRDPSTGQPSKMLMDWLVLAPDVKYVNIRQEHLLIDPVQASPELCDVWREQTSGILLSTQLNG